MQSSSWIALLKIIPPAQQDNIVLTTNNGTDIAVQSVIRAERDFLVLRGRLTGTTDGGGFFFLPYDQIVYLGFQRPWKEAEIRAMFGEVAPKKAKDAEASEKVPTDADAASETTAPEAAAPTSPDASKASDPQAAGQRVARKSSPAIQPASPNKIALLERLRTRRSESSAGGP